MKIKEITSRNRRDFRAIYECEGCGNVTPAQSGYDDRNFHDNVIPAMVCCACRKSSIMLGTKVTPTALLYPEGLNV